MTTGSLDRERIDPDQGPIASACFSALLAVLAAIASAAATAIGAAVVFELAPIPGGQAEQLVFIGKVSRFAAELAGGLGLAVSYRRCRGLPAYPRRLTIGGLLKSTAVLGLIVARFEVLLGPWLPG